MRTRRASRVVDLKSLAAGSRKRYQPVRRARGNKPTTPTMTEQNAVPIALQFHHQLDSFTIRVVEFTKRPKHG